MTNSNNSAFKMPWWRTLIVSILSLYIIPLEMIIHNQFGVRYFGIRAALSFLLLLTAIGFYSYNNFFILAFVLFLFLRMIKHYKDIFLRERRNIMWHSRSPGISWIFSIKPNRDEIYIQMYLEPLVCFLVGIVLIAMGYLIIRFFNPLDNMPIYLVNALIIIGLYISNAAIIIFIRNQILAWQERVIRWNMIDRKIESENRSKFFMTDAPQKETKGFIKMGTKPQTLRARQELVDMYQQSDSSAQYQAFSNNPN